MLIKGKDTISGLTVRDLTAATRVQTQSANAAAVDPQSTLSGASPDVLALEAELERMRAETRSLVESAKRAEKQAFEDGRKAAIAEYRRQETELADSIAASASKAQSALDAQLAETETLALALASVAIESVMGNPDNFADQIAEAVRAQLDEVRAQSVIQIRVSASDFKEGSQGFERMEALAQTNVDWVCDEALPTGQLIMDLRLGEFTLNLTEHWHSVSERLKATVQSNEGRLT